MTTILTAATAKVACDAIVDLLDGGTGAGNIEWRESDDSPIVETTLEATAFGAATTADPSVATLAQGSGKVSAAHSGATVTVAKAAFRDGDDLDHWVDNVGTGSESITFPVTAQLGDGEQINLSAYTFQVTGA